MDGSSADWKDIDWCDRHVHAASLGDDELLEAAGKVHPCSTAMGELIHVAIRRRMTGILPIARQQLDNADSAVAIEAMGALGEFGDSQDVPRLLTLIDEAVDHIHLAAILDAILALDPARVDFALDVANREPRDEWWDRDYVVAAVITQAANVLPASTEAVESTADRLIAWANDPRLVPTQRETVYRRMASLPRTEAIEDFFVNFCVHDRGDYPNLTALVNDALRDKAN